jgi:hypothetical protein
VTQKDLEEWQKFVAGVTVNDEPFTADHPGYPIAMAAFYRGRDSVQAPQYAATREALAEVMHKHYYVERSSAKESHCGCGEWVESVQRKPYTTWHQHIADALLVSTGPLLDAGEVAAKALGDAALDWHQPHDPSTYEASDWLMGRATTILEAKK